MSIQRHCDMVWGNKTRLVWQKNDGQQHFSEPVIIDKNMGWTSSITGADLDGDGNYELVVSTSSYANTDPRNDLVAVYKSTHVLYSSENTTAQKMRIYHNPASNRLYIESQFKVQAVEIFTVEGKRIKQTSGSTVDVSSLVQGAYLITISDFKGQSQTLKFIKK